MNLGSFIEWITACDVPSSTSSYPLQFEQGKSQPTWTTFFTSLHIRAQRYGTSIDADYFMHGNEHPPTPNAATPQIDVAALPVLCLVPILTASTGSSNALQ